ncbi:MAG: HEAT repeat domain-containing protein [Anaerolineales bacterium]|nr:HEAT repeat domain-containing protein [Anaerolineales bacterium]
MALFGPPNIDKLKTRGDVEGLIKALDYKKESRADSKVRASAARALGELKAEQAVEHLIKALDEYWLKDSVQEALANIGTPAVGQLNALLKHKDFTRKKIAATVLCDLQDKRSYPHFLALLDDYSWELKEIAIQALGKYGDPAAIDPILTVVADPEIKLGSRNRIEDAAEFALSKLGAADFDKLAAAMNHSNYLVRPVVIRAMHKLCKTEELRARAIPLLVTVLNEDSHSMFAAAGALGGLKAVEAVESLISQLQDTRRYLDITVLAAALGKIGDPRATAPLVKSAAGMYSPGHTPNNAQKSAREAVKQIGAPAVPALLELLDDPELAVRQVAAECLVEMNIEKILGPEEIRAILKKKKQIKSLEFGTKHRDTTDNCDNHTDTSEKIQLFRSDFLL